MIIRMMQLMSIINANDDNVVTYSHSSEPNRKDLTLFPGKYRTTPYTIKNRNDFYDNYFNAFKLARGITILKNTGYKASNKFTWNYSTDANANGIGHWRGIYKHYFENLITVIYSKFIVYNIFNNKL